MKPAAMGFELSAERETKKARKPKQQWWAEQRRDIADRILMIAARVDCAGGVQQSLDEQFRDLRAALDVFEAQCRERASRWEAMKPNNLVGSDFLPGFRS